MHLHVLAISIKSISNKRSVLCNTTMWPREKKVGKGGTHPPCISWTSHPWCNISTWQHTAKYVCKNTEIFKKQKQNLLQWPSDSPDLNIIENVWLIIDKQLLKYQVHNLEELKNIIIKIWTEISSETIKNLYFSMSGWLKHVNQNESRRKYWVRGTHILEKSQQGTRCGYFENSQYL